MVELVIFVCAVIFVSATCSLAEAVLYAVPVSYVESLAQKGTVSGRILKDLRMRNVDRPISAILSLNTIANTGGAFLAGAAFIKVYGAEWEHYFYDIYYTLGPAPVGGYSQDRRRGLQPVPGQSDRDTASNSGPGNVPVCRDMPACDPGILEGSIVPGGLRRRNRLTGADGEGSRRDRATRSPRDAEHPIAQTQDRKRCHDPADGRVRVERRSERGAGAKGGRDLAAQPGTCLRE